MPPVLLRRVLTLLRDTSRPNQNHLDLHTSCLFGRSIYRLGASGDDARHYCGWFSDPVSAATVVPLAITLAIYGFPFPPVITLHVG